MSGYSNGNIEGRFRNDDFHKFTWQPHGSQFTIVEKIPKNSLIIKINRIGKLDRKLIIKELGFKKSWISIARKSD